MSELLPCPFCGSSNIEDTSTIRNDKWGKCRDCGAESPRWNTRPLTPNVPTEPGRYRMTEPRDVEVLRATRYWQDGSKEEFLMVRDGKIQRPNTDITAHFERIEEDDHGE